MSVTIRLRSGTAAQWTAANPILAAGEKGIETDTNKEKNGNGTTAWNSLSYVSSGSGGAVSSVAGRTGAVTLTKTDVALNNVDNTSDANKPVSTAQATALATKAAVITGAQDRITVGNPNHLPIADINTIGSLKPDNITCTMNQQGVLTVFLPNFSNKGVVVPTVNDDGEIEFSLNFSGRFLGWGSLDLEDDATVVTVGALRALGLIS